MFGCVCGFYNTEYFWIICFLSESVVWMYIDSMGCRLNVKRLIPHANSSIRWPMTRSHGGYKLFVSCSIFFAKLEIGAITGEYRRSPLTRDSILYSWVVKIVPLPSEGYWILVLKGFMLAPVVRISGLYLSAYLSFKSLAMYHGWIQSI